MRRAKVQEQFVKDFNEKTGANVEYIEAEYKPHEFMKMAKEKGLTEEPEGGLRCTACFEMRLEIVAQAKSNMVTIILEVPSHFLLKERATH